MIAEGKDRNASDSSFIAHPAALGEFSLRKTYK